MIHIACAADENYLPHCAAMLHSVLDKHPPKDLAVHFLQTPVMADNVLQPLADMVTAQGGAFHTHRIPDDWVAGLPRLERIPPAMWYRIFLPQLLPDCSRVLYLDCDTLLMDNMTPLWETPLEGYHLAAVANVLEPAMQHWPQQLGLPADQPYFNSGVLLLNLDSMREHQLTRKLLDYGRKQGGNLRWPDQDALNAILGGRCKWLHPRWNCQNSLFYYPRSSEVFGEQTVREAVRSPGILHFEGHHIVKPWHCLSKHPYRKHYFQHRRATPWPTVELQDATLFNRVLRLLPASLMFMVYKRVVRLRRKLGFDT